jgi:hypothetical protein
MENINLRSIRWESIKSVFLSIAKSEKTSRADISTDTDLSLMTVGKVADALMNIEAIEQYKESRNSAGRRAGLLSIKQNIFSIILDLRTKDFVCCLMDLRLNAMKKLPYSYVDSMPFCENLDRFLDTVSSFVSTHMSDGVCIGVGAAIPGSYIPTTNRSYCRDLPELDTVDLAQTIRNHFPNLPLEIDSAYNAAAVSPIQQIRDYKDKVIFCWCVTENSIRGAIVPNGKVLHGAHHSAGDFGSVVVHNGATLNSLVKHTNSPQANAAALVRSIHNAIRLADPDAIILECPMYENGEDFCNLVRNMLMEEYSLSAEMLPEILVATGDVPHAYRGITMQLRENWLHERIFSQG